MKRALLDAVLPIATIALAAAFVAPNALRAGGESMLVLGSERAGFQPANFSETCAAPQLTVEDEPVNAAGLPAGLRVVTLALRSGGSQATAEGEVPATAKLVLFLDQSGRVIGANDVAEMLAAVSADAHACSQSAAADELGSI